MLDVYGQLAEPSRRLILLELRTGPKSVSDLVERTGLKQPNVSNHLAKLRSRGIVRSNKVGRLVYYALATPDVHAAVVNVFGNSNSGTINVDLRSVSEEFAKLAMDGDETSCCTLVDSAMRSGAEILDIFADVIGAGLESVSNMRNSGAIDISEQRIAVATAERALARISQIVAPRRPLSEVAILGCAPGSWYTARLRMVGDYLQMEGWRSLLLGPNAPEEAFVAATVRHQPRIVIIGCGDAAAETEAAGIAKRLASIEGNHRVGCLLGGDSRPHADPSFAFHARNIRDFAERWLPVIAPISMDLGAS